MRELFSSAKRSEVVTHRARGNSKLPHTLGALCGNSLNSTAPLSPRKLGKPQKQKQVSPAQKHLVESHAKRDDYT